MTNRRYFHTSTAQYEDKNLRNVENISVRYSCINIKTNYQFANEIKWKLDIVGKIDSWITLSQYYFGLNLCSN
uniref:Uncharacterized protein n=1 Tax=Trichobilharzia regenti TaxID=157069 RepID=A0AA85K0F1_TRIRE|nr:unnamed protein product [Trichobilharzia regenti]